VPAGYRGSFLGTEFSGCSRNWVVFEEAKASFLYGNFAAAVVLASAFVNHWFTANFCARGCQKEAQGLAAYKLRTSHQSRRFNNLGQSGPLKVDTQSVSAFERVRSSTQNQSPNDENEDFDVQALLEVGAREAGIVKYGVAAYAFAG
jgi:hypothetical protein